LFFRKTTEGTHNIITQPKHSPDGKKSGGADAASLGGPLVMLIVRLTDEKIEINYIY
jgi:hypothetical protein